MTEGACISISCERSMWPLCSSMRATPLKIITTARRSVHTLMGSKEAFSTKTRAFMIEADITRASRKVSKISVGAHASLRAVRRLPWRLLWWKIASKRLANRRQGCLRSGSVLLAKLVRRLDQRAQIARLRDRMAGVRRNVQLGFRPRAMQVPRARHRTDCIVATLDDHAGNVANLADVFN